MSHNEVLTFAAGVIREECSKRGFGVVRILLFGSRARGTAGRDSDWDFFVGVDREIEFAEKSVIASAVRTRLAEQNLSADVLIRSWDKARQESANTGVMSHYALKDGVAI